MSTLRNSYNFLKHSPKKPIRNIPKIMHFIFEPFRYASIPDEWKLNIEKFRTLNPDYVVMIHTLSDSESLLSESYPELYVTYCGLRDTISKIDYTKYIMLYHYGGLYADLDITWFRSLRDLVIGGWNMILCKEKDYAIRNQINNCFMACKKKSDFILRLLRDCEQTNHLDIVERVLHTTGPVFLTKTFHKSYPKLTELSYLSNTTTKPLLSNNILILPTLFTSNIEKKDQDPRFLIFHHNYDSSWTPSSKPYS